MTKGVFRGYLGALVAVILFSLSPLAPLGGLLVAVVIVAPVGIILGALGLLAKGSGFDDQLAMLFWGFSGLLAIAALWFAYQGASYHERKEHAQARGAAALAATAVAVPVAIYFCYTALGF
ncbi:MAG: hypothetical protein U0995_06450 [Erythrobacter sp.]|nr:hypothetical protein [Erythrobacter sp.]